MEVPKDKKINRDGQIGKEICTVLGIQEYQLKNVGYINCNSSTFHRNTLDKSDITSMMIASPNKTQEMYEN